MTLDEVKLLGLQLFQPREGYRYSLDAFLLSRFCSLVRPEGSIIDLGAGCGVISLMLARINSSASVVAVENNPDMAEVIGRNILHNNLAMRVSAHAADVLTLRECYPSSSFDLVVCNPPFRTAGSGKTSPRAGRDAARHETTARLDDFLAAAKYLVKPEGRICFIQHPSRLTDFIRYAGELKLAVHRLRIVHDRISTPATMFLAEVVKGSRASLALLPPLIIRNEIGGYSSEVAEILGEQ